MFFLLQIGQIAVEDFEELRTEQENGDHVGDNDEAAELSALALEMAYPHIDDAVLDELLHIDHDFDIAGRSRNVKAAVTMDERFHHRIFELAGNYFLGEFARILESHSQRVENIYFSQNNEIDFQSHQDILAALKRKDLPAAKEAMRHNWLHTVELLREKQEVAKSKP